VRLEVLPFLQPNLPFQEAVEETFNLLTRLKQKLLSMLFVAIRIQLIGVFQTFRFEEKPTSLSHHDSFLFVGVVG
jgi:hypothetical protein